MAEVGGTRERTCETALATALLMALFCCWMICAPSEKGLKCQQDLAQMASGFPMLNCPGRHGGVLSVCTRHHDEHKLEKRTCTADRARAKAALVAFATAVAMDWELAADMPWPANPFGQFSEVTCQRQHCTAQPSTASTT